MAKKSKVDKNTALLLAVIGGLFAGVFQPLVYLYLNDADRCKTMYLYFVVLHALGIVGSIFTLGLGLFLYVPVAILFHAWVVYDVYQKVN